jgi:hypothetical protein
MWLMTSIMQMKRDSFSTACQTERWHWRRKKCEGATHGAAVHKQR